VVERAVWLCGLHEVLIAVLDGVEVAGEASSGAVPLADFALDVGGCVLVVDVGELAEAVGEVVVDELRETYVGEIVHAGAAVGDLLDRLQHRRDELVEDVVDELVAVWADVLDAEAVDAGLSPGGHETKAGILGGLCGRHRATPTVTKLWADCHPLVMSVGPSCWLVLGFL